MGKAPGPDHIVHLTVKELVNVIPGSTMKVMNYFLSEQSYPDSDPETLDKD